MCLHNYVGIKTYIVIAQAHPTDVGSIRVWKPLPSRRVLKTLRGSLKRKAQRRQYLLAVGLGCYKWYQSQNTGRCASEEADPWRRVDMRRCVRRWVLKGGGLGSPTSIRERNECQRGCWALKGGGLWDPTSVGEENGTFFIRVWKPFSSRRVLKTLRGSQKEKAQRGQCLLVVGLGYFKWYQSQTPGDVPARRLIPEGGWT